MSSRLAICYPINHGISELRRTMVMGMLGQKLGHLDEFTITIASASGNQGFVSEVEKLVSKAETFYEVERVNPLAMRISYLGQTLLVHFINLTPDA